TWRRSAAGSTRAIARSRRRNSSSSWTAPRHDGIERRRMTPDAFLELALSLPQTTVGRHQAGEGGKILASPATRAGGSAVVKLTLEQRDVLCAAEPDVFAPVVGMGASRGWTRVFVTNADEATARSALQMAWRNAAPPKVRRDFPELAA